MAFGFRGTPLALTAALCFGGLAAAQGLSGDSTLAPATATAPDDTQSALQALAAARSGDGYRVRGLLDQTTDPLTRKIALWSLADATPEVLTWDQADAARRDLGDWPRPLRRQSAAEKLIERSGLSPQATIAWFAGSRPVTGEGAMALANALRQTGQPEAAAAVIRQAWRALTFDQPTQQTLLQRFGDLLTPADHEAREDFLLFGVHGQAANDLLPFLSPSAQAIAQARMAVRRGDPAAATLIQALPPSDQLAPGLVYERVMAARDRGDIGGALSLIGYLPGTLPDEHAAERLWKHGALVVGALQAGDAVTAYQVAARSGLTSGPEAASAQFYAGWIAFSRLKDPRLADQHFARLQAIAPSPISQSRALYWRGRAADATGDPLAAQLFYEQASQFYTTFYGQLAATRVGKTDLILGHDPIVTDDERARFEARDAVRATRLLHTIGARDGFRAFVTGLSESLDTAADEAMLVDLARGYGEQELSMRVVRNAAHRGFILPERGYPVLSQAYGAPGVDAPLVLGITRQESSFDPNARSGAGARGLMQLMPATAENVARRSGLGRGRLEDPDFNLKVGSVYLGQLVSQFSGSYVMASAAYNAGPSRPTQWVGLCGDPRASTVDPLDFIECIPFSETRDYVMRVLEAAQVYRARLNGGSAPMTLAADLKRGSYASSPLGVALAAPLAAPESSAPAGR